MTPQRWTRYAALGDSITEGWCDPVLGDGEPWFGWADRLALAIDAAVRSEGGERIEFANLGVRGRRIHHVVDDQIPAALAMRADLVSILIGGNDLMSFRVDPDALAARLEAGIARLRAADVDVLLATAFDPGPLRALRVLRVRTAIFNAHLAAIAQRHGCRLVDLWGVEGLRDGRFWSEDRIHPSTTGHLRIANAAAAVLGLPEIRSDAPVALTAQIPFTVWLRRHLAPWLGRRVRRVSSGDGRGPKLPEPTPIAVVDEILTALRRASAG